MLHRVRVLSAAASVGKRGCVGRRHIMASCLSRRAGGGGGGGGCGGSAALGRAASFGLEAASAHARACSRRDNRLSEARRVWSGPGATSNQGSFSLSGERDSDLGAPARIRACLFLYRTEPCEAQAGVLSLCLIRFQGSTVDGSVGTPRVKCSCRGTALDSGQAEGLYRLLCYVL